MRELGYRPRFDWIVSSGLPSSVIPGEYNYRDEKRRIMVELHTELTLRHFPEAPDLEDFSKRLTFVKLNEREVPTFSVEDALLVLSLHGAKDFWERFSWIADTVSYTHLDVYKRQRYEGTIVDLAAPLYKWTSGEMGARLSRSEQIGRASCRERV